VHFAWSSGILQDCFGLRLYPVIVGLK